MYIYIFMYIFMHIYIYTELSDAPPRPLATLYQIMWRWRGAEEQAGAGAVLKNQAAPHIGGLTSFIGIMNGINTNYQM